MPVPPTPPSAPPAASSSASSQRRQDVPASEVPATVPHADQATRPGRSTARRTSLPVRLWPTELYTRMLRKIPDLVHPDGVDRGVLTPEEERRAMRHAFRMSGLSILGVLAVGTAVITYLTHRPPPVPEVVSFRSPVGQPGLGAANARVQVTLFTDFSCLGCLDAERQLIPAVEAYLRKGRSVRLTLYNAPLLGQSSLAAAGVAHCAWTLNPSKLVQVRSVLFNEQTTADDWFNDATLKQVAQAGDLNEGLLERCVRSTHTQDAVADETAEYRRVNPGTEDLGLMLPGLYIDGHPVDPTASALQRATDYLLVHKAP